jgi:hypothetical protein
VTTSATFQELSPRLPLIIYLPLLPSPLIKFPDSLNNSKKDKMGLFKHKEKSRVDPQAQNLGPNDAINHASAQGPPPTNITNPSFHDSTYYTESNVSSSETPRINQPPPQAQGKPPGTTVTTTTTTTTSKSSSSLSIGKIADEYVL